MVNNLLSFFKSGGPGVRFKNFIPEVEESISLKIGMLDCGVLSFFFCALTNDSTEMRVRIHTTTNLE
jgi:hypothetical protein